MDLDESKQCGEKNVGKWKEVIGEKHVWGVYHDGGDDVARHNKHGKSWKPLAQDKSDAYNTV